MENIVKTEIKKAPAMKVFCCRMTSGLCGNGIVLVVAKNIQEAYDTFGKEKELSASVLETFYPLEKWYEFENLHYTANCPQVILYEEYIE